MNPEWEMVLNGYTWRHLQHWKWKGPESGLPFCSSSQGKCPLPIVEVPEHQTVVRGVSIAGTDLQ